MTRMMSMFAAAVLLTTAGCNRESAPAANQAMPTETAAAGSIDGTWKTDLASVQIEEQPSTYLLKDGTYSCSTCVPPLTVAADGAFHPVADRPYYDSMAVKVVDDRTVTTTRKKGDKVTSESTVVISPDGQTSTFTFSDSSTPDAPPVTGKGSETRVAAAPAGAHAISGSWKTAKYDAVSDEALTFTMRLDGDTLTMSSPSGQSYTAKLDGSDAPVKGDIAGTVVSVERLAPNSFRETYKRDGKTVNVNTMTLGDGGKLASVSENVLQKSTMRYTSAKQ